MGRNPPVLFSGGSLLVGGAARTDLISPSLTGELTRRQFHTIHRAFEKLPGETALYPTHGGGSFCSIGSSDRRVSTLGEERSANPALAVIDEDEFATWFPSTFPAAPDYFFRLRPVNQAGPRLVREVLAPPALGPAEFDRARKEALVVDVRPIAEYSQAHIPGALSIEFRDVYATWLGWLVPLETPLLFVAGGVPLDLVLGESLLVGSESFAGWLEGGVEAWEKAGMTVSMTAFTDAPAVRKALADGAVAVDVRETGEFSGGHVQGAINIPLGRLARESGRLPRDRPIVTYCGHGERAATGASVLERTGFRGIINMRGGLGAWSEAGYQVAT
jgi:rhodanese-related sulfurtransferase